MKNQPRILVVDDEIDFAQAIRAALEAKAYQVNIASSRARMPVACPVPRGPMPSASVVGKSS